MHLDEMTVAEISVGKMFAVEMPVDKMNVYEICTQNDHRLYVCR
jgi:hypothetical protein